MGIEQDIINKINQKKSPNIPFIKKDFLDSIHEKITNNMLRIDPNKKEKGNNTKNTTSTKAQQVIEADTAFRNALSNLVIALTELGDKELSQQLLGEHILMLNEMFKTFEK